MVRAWLAAILAAVASSAATLALVRRRESGRGTCAEEGGGGAASERGGASCPFIASRKRAGGGERVGSDDDDDGDDEEEEEEKEEGQDVDENREGAGGGSAAPLGSPASWVPSYVESDRAVLNDIMMRTIAEAQSMAVEGRNPVDVFDRMLMGLLSLTSSGYGFISQVKTDEASKQPYISTIAISNISWNEATAAFYRDNYETGLEFHNLKTLFGEVLVTRRHVISNDPHNDPRRGGNFLCPSGHPPLNSFMGIPFFFQREMVGMVGISNRPGGYDEDLLELLRPFLVTCATLIRGIDAEIERRRTVDAKSMFWSNVAHELRTPLTGIIGVTEIILADEMASHATGAEAEARAENLRMVLKSGHSILTIVNSVLDYSSFVFNSKERVHVKYSRFSLRALLDSVLLTFGADAAENRVLVYCDLPAGGDEVTSDVYLIHRVLRNMVSNAVKFTRCGEVWLRVRFGSVPSGGGGGGDGGGGGGTEDEASGAEAAGAVARLREEAASAGGTVSHLEVEVVDRGSGVDESKLEEIFAPFTQADNSNTRPFGGTGLGLATSRGIARRLGGFVWARANQDGAGSTFKMSVPVLRHGTGATDEVEEAEEKAGEKGEEDDGAEEAEEERGANGAEEAKAPARKGAPPAADAWRPFSDQGENETRGMDLLSSPKVVSAAISIRGSRLLMVERGASMVAAVRSQLALAGVTVTVCESAAAAARLVRGGQRGTFDAVMLGVASAAYSAIFSETSPLERRMQAEEVAATAAAGPGQDGEMDGYGDGNDDAKDGGSEGDSDGVKRASVESETPAAAEVLVEPTSATEARAVEEIAAAGVALVYLKWGGGDASPVVPLLRRLGAVGVSVPVLYSALCRGVALAVTGNSSGGVRPSIEGRSPSRSGRTLRARARARSRRSAATSSALLQLASKPAAPQQPAPATVAAATATDSTSGGGFGASETHGAEEVLAARAAARVLIVDDNKINCRVIKRLLQNAGFANISLAFDGQQAVEEFSASCSGAAPPFELVVMDIQMPRVDGYEAAARIRKMDAAHVTATRPWIIATSASMSPATVVLCQKAGMNDSLSKPLTVKRLRAALRSWSLLTAGAATEEGGDGGDSSTGDQ